MSEELEKAKETENKEKKTLSNKELDKVTGGTSSPELCDTGIGSEDSDDTIDKQSEGMRSDPFILNVLYDAK